MLAQAPFDKGEPALKVLMEDKTFVVAQNLNENVPEESFNLQLQNSPRHSTFIERMMVNQPSYVQSIYLALIVIIYFVLVMTIVNEFRLQHAKNIASGIILLCFLAALAYINSGFLLSVI